MSEREKAVRRAVAALGKLTPDERARVATVLYGHGSER